MCWHCSHKAHYRDSTGIWQKYTNNTINENSQKRDKARPYWYTATAMMMVMMMIIIMIIIIIIIICRYK